MAKVPCRPPHTHTFRRFGNCPSDVGNNSHRSHQESNLGSLSESVNGEAQMLLNVTVKMTISTVITVHANVAASTADWQFSNVLT